MTPAAGRCQGGVRRYTGANRPDGMTLGQATERLATLQREVADLQEQVKQLLTQRLENAAAQQVNRRTAHSKKKGTNA